MVPEHEPQHKTAKPRTSGRGTRRTGTSQTSNGAHPTTDQANVATSRVPPSSLNALRGVTGMTSRIVEQAASILEEEIAAGIVAAKRVEQRFADVDELRNGRSDEVMHRFRRDAHEVVDMLLDVVNLATRSIGELAQGVISVRNDDTQPASSMRPSVIPALNVPGVASAGQRIEVPLVLENDGDHPTSALEIHCADLISLEGQRIAAACISFAPSPLVIAAHDKQTLTVVVSVPDDIRPGVYSGLLQATNLQQLRAVLSIQIA